MNTEQAVTNLSKNLTNAAKSMIRTTDNFSEVVLSVEQKEAIKEQSYLYYQQMYRLQTDFNNDRIDAQEAISKQFRAGEENLNSIERIVSGEGKTN